MSLLMWDKPEKIMTTEEWRAISADSAPPGVYVSNMSHDDRLRWKAKKIGGGDPRVEIRKTVIPPPAGPIVNGRRNRRGSYAQMLVIVRPDGVTMSMNATAEFPHAEFTELIVAVTEARAALS
jgi:hypothetical protein